MPAPDRFHVLTECGSACGGPAASGWQMSSLTAPAKRSKGEENRRGLHADRSSRRQADGPATEEDSCTLLPAKRSWLLQTSPDSTVTLMI